MKSILYFFTIFLLGVVFWLVCGCCGIFIFLPLMLKKWCRRRDSNPHGLLHTPLKRACLPVPPLRRFMPAEISDCNYKIPEGSNTTLLLK